MTPANGLVKPCDFDDLAPFFSFGVTRAPNAPLFIVRFFVFANVAKTGVFRVAKISLFSQRCSQMALLSHVIFAVFRTFFALVSRVRKFRNQNKIGINSHISVSESLKKDRQ